MLKMDSEQLFTFLKFTGGEQRSLPMELDIEMLVQTMSHFRQKALMKSLEKDRTRRYGSPSEISADITRYLHDEPVLAAPPSAAYRLQKFARRNRGLLAALCAMLFIIAMGTVASIYEAVRARKAEHLAILQRDRADSGRPSGRHS